MLNSLTEPMIRIATSHGLHWASLPEVYAALMADGVESFPALRPHQRHAWHAFLVQLAAMAMHRAGVTEPPETATKWAALIRGLTADDFPDDEPWQLVSADITKPAFMQPPASAPGKENDYNGVVATPDELDIISTSKNHDIKTGILDDGGSDVWIFALINLQTMGGQIGNGHYPISRMQSGWNSRTAFTLAPSLRWGKHIARDITALLAVDFKGWPMRWDGIGLLWTKPWDGKKWEALTLDKLHPYYLEICRRRRLKVGPNGLCALQTTSEGRRLATEGSRGAVGDPWELVDKRDKKGNKALAMQKDSFAYDRIVDYLFQGSDWDLPVLFQSKSADKFLVARGVKGDRGGQTEGYYERIIPLRPKTIQVFGRNDGPKELEDIARERIADIRNAQRILRRAVATFAAHGDSQPSVHRNGKPSPNDIASPWVNQLDEIVDERFFDDLQTEFEETQDAERRKIRELWLADFVIPNANAILDASRQSIPCPDSQSLRAFAASQNVFNGRTYQEFNVSLDQSPEA